ncbi:MAG: relaxase [Alphaproteobacteria bacterium]|nr:relaxase [Alphaproteobacteria bacterium]
MILVGNQRGGAKDLARHLLKEENEHVEVHELRGFASDNLQGALNEAYAVSRGTRCKQFLFSLSLNSPPHEEVRTEDFESAIAQAESKLGLTGQPRAIVFHEKEGRRHAHAVWSRIKAEEMKAVQLSHSKLKLMDVSRELFLEHEWKMPRGLTDRSQRDPKNFTHEQWQQAKRIGKDPRALKTALEDAWVLSDSKTAFKNALEERGYKLARGDRRGFVAVDYRGEVYAIRKWAGVRTKNIRERLGDESTLQSVDQAKAQFAREMLNTLGRFQTELDEKQQKKNAEFERSRLEMIARQRLERETLRQNTEQRRLLENQERQARFRSGLKGLWDRLNGERKRIAEQNQREAQASLRRNRTERDRLIFRQLEERRSLSKSQVREHETLAQQKQEIHSNAQVYKDMQTPPREERRQRFKEQRRTKDTPRPRRARGLTREPGG